MHLKRSGNGLMGTGHVAFTAPRPLIKGQEQPYAPEFVRLLPTTGSEV
jgi:hypothetical protein